jgi:hypothetical protein
MKELIVYIGYLLAFTIILVLVVNQNKKGYERVKEILEDMLKFLKKLLEVIKYLLW